MKAANARAAQRLATNPTAVAARYDSRVGRVVIALSSGLEIAFKLHDAQGLELARPAQLAEIEISPSGLGLHFPKLDADLYLPALLEGFLGSRRGRACPGDAMYRIHHAGRQQANLNRSTSGPSKFHFQARRNRYQKAVTF